MEALVRNKQAKSPILSQWASAGPSYFDAQAYGCSPAASAAANKTAIDAAVAAANTAGGGIVVLPRGAISVNNLGTISTNNVVLQGQGDFSGGTAFYAAQATGDFAVFSGQGHSGIRDVYLSAGVRRTSGYALKFTGGAFNPTADRIRIDYHYNGILIDHVSEAQLGRIRMRYMHGSRGINIGGAGSSQLVTGATIRDFNADNPFPGNENGTIKTWATSTAFNLHDIVRTAGGIYQCTGAGTSAASGSGPTTIPGTGPSDAFSSTLTDGTVTWKFVCHPGLTWLVQDSYAYSVAVHDAALLKGYKGFVMLDAAASGTSRPKWFNSVNLEVDHAYADAVHLQAGEGVYLTQAWLGSSRTGRGLLVDSGFAGELAVDASEIQGNWLDGILLQSGSKMASLTGNKIGLNSQASVGTYNGITLAAGCTDVIATGNTSGRTADGNGQQGYGFVATATADRYVITGNNFSGNHTGGASGATDSSKIIANNLV